MERDDWVRAHATRRSIVGTNGAPRCFVNPGWHHGLGIAGREEWLAAAVEAPAPPGVGGVAAVLVGLPQGANRVSMCGYVVDTWCLGVKNALGPERLAAGEFEALRRRYFAPWGSSGIPISIELARHLVLGAVEYAHRLGFAPHRDLRRARGALGAWEGPGAITFGHDGAPDYRSGPYDDPARVLATLDRTVGRGGYRYTCTITNREKTGEAA